MRRILLTIAAMFVATSAVAQPFLRVRHTPGSGVAQLTWTQVSGAASYTVRRASVYPSWNAPVAVGSATTYDYSVSANAAYVFQVVPYNGSGQAMTASNVALLTTHAFSAEELVAIRAQFLSELRAMVDAARAAAGAGAMSWTHAPPTVGTPIYKEYFSDVRSGIDGALQNIGYPSLPAYTDPVLGSTVGIKKIHVEEMRARVRGYPEWTATSLSDFSASKDRYQMRVAGGEVTTYTIVRPSFPVTVELQISAMNGTRVKTYQFPAGVNSYAWNGSTDTGGIAGNGAYQYKVVVTDIANPSNTLTWNDDSSVGGAATQYPYPFCRNASGNFVRCSSSGPFHFDPYANKPLRIKFCVGDGNNESYSCTPSALPSYVIVKAPSSGETDASCGVDCISGDYRVGGDAELPWYGLNIAGSYIADRPYLAVIRQPGAITRNMTVVYESGPVITDLAITPLVFNPAYGSQSYSVTTSGPVSNVTAEFKNLTSGVLLRTIDQVSSTSPHVIQWDGRSDSFGSDGPMLVAPGSYEVTIIVRDAFGREARLSPMITVQY